MAITYASAHNDGYQNAIDDIFEFIENHITELLDHDKDSTEVEALLDKLQSNF